MFIVVHIKFEVNMYTRFTTSKKSKHPTLQIVQGIREGKKVKQKIIASFGVVKTEKDKKRLVAFAENFIQKLQENDFPVEPKIALRNLLHQETVYDGFSIVAERLMELSGFSQVIQKAQGKKSFELEKIVNLILTQRLDLPSSKLRTFERQEEHGFQGIELQHLYRTMDALEPLSSEIQKAAFLTVCSYSDKPVDCFFFDVTTLYFESVVEDDLKNFGFSKDLKHHTVQVVLALVVDVEGNPIAYEVFEGDLAETKTLIPVLESLRSRFSIKNVTVVCDRGLASQANIQALKDSEFHYVIAAKLRSISKKIPIHDLSLFQPLPHQENVPDEEKVFYRVMEHPQYEDATLIITYSPDRAEKDKKDRERLLDKLKEKLSSEGAIKKIISNNGYKKFTNVKKGSSVALNEKAVEEDASWDGFHGIAVSNGAKLSVVEALSRYHDLWRVEETFRVAKSTLKTRPIYHWKPHRIKGHVLLCFMTLFVERFLESLMRKNGYPLTPDKIRHALSGVHTMFFEEQGSGKNGKMESVLSEDAKKIFEILNIETKRQVAMV
jgi:transposase